MYSLLNSQVSTANYVLVSMPWLRPGFNCWVDPLYRDTIYYISEVQQQGNPTEGATTVVSLIFGRPRGEFASNAEAFGAMNDASDNVFVNTMNSEQRIKGSDGKPFKMLNLQRRTIMGTKFQELHLRAPASFTSLCMWMA